jgi:eukaryotic-like serine/threonine-protein kinase
MRSRDYRPGEQVPGTVYQVLRLIGAGGMGTVYDVEDTTIGKRYVLKTLHPQLGAREDLARRIQNEARTLARLNHPNIVEVITAGVTADDLRLPYYLMERLSGQSLRLVLEKKGQLELPHAYHIGIDLLDALDHAHDKGVIHRDVKPDNIFLHRTAAGVTVTKLLDFGIVSMLDASAGETAGRFVGTLRYAAPEQLRGEKPTPKTDVYSAGLVIYEIIAGRGPFDDEGDAQWVAAAHMNKVPPPVSRFVAVPAELEALLMASLAKNPDARPRDAFSFAASLRNLKRVLQGSQSQESTENRVTAPAVLPLDAPAASSTVTAATALPRTTMPGMPQPTVGPPPEPTPTAPDLIDRVATTQSLLPDTPPTPQQGTEALPVPLPSASPLAKTLPYDDLPQGAPIAPIQWPPERAAGRSLEPQVRPLSVPPRRLAVAPLVAAALAATALIATAGTLIAVRRASATNASSGGNAVVAAPVTAGSAVHVQSMPAPLPSVEVAPSPSSEIAPTEEVPSVVPSAPPARPVPRTPPALRLRPPSTAVPADDRPGPGF